MRGLYNSIENGETNTFSGLKMAYYVLNMG